MLVNRDPLVTCRTLMVLAGGIKSKKLNLDTFLKQASDYESVEPGWDRLSDLPMGEGWYLSQGIDVADSDRGGRVTYHGPGQLVGYPIMRVRDVYGYVEGLESAMIAALADEGIEAETREGLTGVWAGERKIGAIGVHVSRGVTTHGFAVNVDGDLQPFEWIVACGGDGARPTSIYLETQRTGAMQCFSKRVAWRTADTFGLRQRLVSRERLMSVIDEIGTREPVPA